MIIKSEKNKSNEPRVNEVITSSPVRVVSDTSEMFGVMNIEEAISLADSKGLDLVEISPNASPPVCKIMNFGKYKYQLHLKAKEAKRKQKVIEIKEIKYRPNIGQHDYDIKLRNAKKFLADENKVRITVQFKGREITHQENAINLLNKLQEDLADVAKVEFAPKLDGKQMLLVLSPK